MITFSLKPLNVSTIPNVAAFVRTLVVSWKEAAVEKSNESSPAPPEKLLTAVVPEND